MYQQSFKKVQILIWYRMILTYHEYVYFITPQLSFLAYTGCHIIAYRGKDECVFWGQFGELNL